MLVLLGGQLSGEQLFGGQLSGEQSSGDNCPGGNYPGGNCPVPICNTHQVRYYHFFIFEVIVESVNLITHVKIK